MAITSTPRYRARITSQGQITIPKAVRDRLGAVAGDELEFEPNGDDGFTLKHRPRISVLDFAGIAGRASRRIPATGEGLDALIRDGRQARAAARDARVRGKSSVTKPLT